MAAAAVSVVEISPGVKFDPEDDVLVAHYLVPRLRGQRLPVGGVIIEADPLIAPPWELLEEHSRGKGAFFFSAGHARSGKGGAQKRACAGGGYWKGQRKTSPVDGEKLAAFVPGTGEEVAWRKHVLLFHADGQKGSTGWVMEEYAVTAPSDLVTSSSVMAYHIRFTGHGKKNRKAGARAAPPLPPLEDYPSAAEATQSEQGSSGEMERAHEGLNDSPAAGDVDVVVGF